MPLAAIRRLSSSLRRPASDGRKRINLALQGGGAHGAFTWGVLDHLLEDGRFVISGISGTSAGAMNAVMLADGLARGGPDEARKRLAEFWRAASLSGDLPGVQRAVIDRLFSFLPYDTSPAQLWFNALSRFSTRSAPARARNCSSPRPTSTPATCGCFRRRRSTPTW